MSARAQAVQAPLLPQVNLLPPEVKAARGLNRIKRWLALAIVLALVAAGGLVFMAEQAKNDAEQQLVDAQARTQELTRQKASYAQVPLVRAALDRALLARKLSVSTEVRWRPYMLAIAASAPAGWRIQSMTVISATPMQPAGLPTNPLAEPSVSTLTFQAQAATVPDVETWLRNLDKVPAFADPWFSVAKLEGGPNNEAFYQVTATVTITADGLTNRFAEPEPEADDDETAGEDATEEEG